MKVRGKSFRAGQDCREAGGGGLGTVFVEAGEARSFERA
jgi:hypothetical protein